MEKYTLPEAGSMFGIKEYYLASDVDAHLATQREAKRINDALLLEGAQKIDEQRETIATLQAELEGVRTRLCDSERDNKLFQQERDEARSDRNNAVIDLYRKLDNKDLAIAETKRQLAAMGKLAYIGEHHFVENSWKYRCEELTAQLSSREEALRTIDAMMNDDEEPGDQSMRRVGWEMKMIAKQALKPSA